MNKIKRIISVILTALLALSLLSGCSQGKTSGELTVGDTTELNGRFFTNYWGGSNADNRINTLLHGSLETVVYKKEDSSFGFNERVVPKVDEKDNEDGSKTFTFDLAKDMLYSDGSSIKASDYVFSILFGSHSALLDAGGSEPVSGIYYVGYEDYRNNKTKEFSGVRLIDDYSFSVQIAAENLPYFYDITYAAVRPYPAAVIAPDCTVKDDGKGAYIDGPFSSELLSETVTKSDSGYLYSPSVVSGPYTFDSFDAGSKTAVLKINPKYYGNYEGQKPSIETLIFKTTLGATQIDELAAGSVDLISGIGGADSIPPGLDLVDEGKAEYVSYPRSGFGYLAFHCNIGPTQFQSVRQSIAYLLDVPEFARTYSGGYASVVSGWYGSAHWMAKENAAKIKEEFNTYDLNLDKAKELLIADGWTLNAQGTNYVEGTDTLRYKMVDGTLMPLEILWAQESGNPVSDLLAQMLPDNMSKIGMKLTGEVMDFSVIADNYYGLITDKDGNRVQKYNMYNLAVSFPPVYEPQYTFSSSEQYMGMYNSLFIKDEKLSTLATDLNLTPSTDRETYSQKWFDLQKRFNEVLPAIPLYSDEYYDFFTPELKGYETDSFWTFPDAILYATLEK